MPDIQLRRQLLANNTGIGAPFTAIVDYYSTATRRPFTLQFDSQVNDPAELTRGDEVHRYNYRPGKARVVRYDGNGSVYTENAVGLTPPTLLLKADTLTPYTETAGSYTASVDLTGRLGQPPYQLTLVGTVGTPSAGYRQTAVSSSELFPVRFYNLGEGEYVALVTDAVGGTSIADIKVSPGGGYSRGVGLREEPVLISGVGLQWRFNERDIKTYLYGTKPAALYQKPYGEYVDGYLLPGGLLWRQVYSDGKGGVYFTDVSTTATSTLALDNLIVFHPDSAAEPGGLIVEVIADAPPLTFSLSGVTNDHGRFDGLGAGAGSVLVSDAAGSVLEVPFELQVRYGPRWRLAFSDKFGVPCLLELWLRDYAGPVEDIIGQADPLVLVTDGLNSSIGGQGDLPAVVGSTLDLNLKIVPGLLEDVLVRQDDRYCRCDFRRDGQLRFRGFIKPDTYQENLLDGLLDVSVTAVDGLAALKDTYFEGHIGQRLAGYRPLLHTLLHCLSRCDVSLPVRLFTNRRDSAMATTDPPELAAATNRGGYWDEEKNEPVFCRDVVEALAQVLGGTLVQRAGAWEVRSPLEAAKLAAGRAYHPAGTLLTLASVRTPAGAIVPPRTSPAWYWLTASQAKAVRAGWKSLTGTTDVGWLKNAYPAGNVFSDKYAWLDDTSKLRPINGWHPAPGQLFPLVLSRVGEKGKDLSTRWPRSVTSSLNDNRYLQGPALPLAAGTEAIPALLHIAAKLVPEQYYAAADGSQVASPVNAPVATLPYEILIDGHSTGIRQATFELAASDTAADTVFEVKLEPLPSTATAAEIRLYSWYAPDTGLLSSATTVSGGLQVFKKGDVVRYDFGTGTYRLFVATADTGLGVANGAFLFGLWASYFAELIATDVAAGRLFITSVGVELRPQAATWEGEDNFRADGPGGNIRPTEPLEVYHADVPISAGLYGGNLPAFGKAVALADGTMSTSWARSLDKLPSPIFEANVYDALALRAGASRLLTGIVRHDNCEPPYLLDAIDTPTDVPGRRFLLAAIGGWHVKSAKVEASLIEIGAGAGAANPYAGLGNVLVTEELYEYLPGQYAPMGLATHDGALLAWG